MSEIIKYYFTDKYAEGEYCPETYKVKEENKPIVGDSKRIREFVSSFQNPVVKVNREDILDYLTPYYKACYDKYPEYYDEQTPYKAYENLEWLAPENIVMLGNSLYQYLNDPKTKAEEYMCYVYGAENGNPNNLPKFLKNANIRFDFKKEDIPEFDYEVPNYRIITKFKEEQCGLKIFRAKQDVGDTVIDTTDFVCFCNLPYEIYSTCKLSSKHISYDIVNKEWYATGSKSFEIKDYLDDIAVNGLRSPMVLEINSQGQIINSRDCNTRILLTQYLQLPTIPAVVCYRSFYDINKTHHTFNPKVFNYMSKLFDPYIKFNGEENDK